jgi:hypothetical protein
MPFLLEADLRGADLRGANLWGANLLEADLRGADLRGAELPDSLAGSRNIKVSLETLREWRACADLMAWVESIGGEVSVTDCFAAEKDDYAAWLWGRVATEMLAKSALAEEEGME